MARLSPATGAQPQVELPADHAERLVKGEAQFRDHVAGLLKQHCLKCHGGDKTRSDFDLATRAGLLKGGSEGIAVVPFQARTSRLLKLVRHEDEPGMPLDLPKLKDAEIELLAAWIDNGAPYAEPLIAGKTPPREAGQITDADRQWWSFLPLADVKPPAVKAATDIDRFIADKAKPSGLTIPGPASKVKLLRRAKLDLQGLPPTPEEVATFVADEAPDAYARLIVRLLDSPAYGERWARHWLDVARFAESSGFEHDYDRQGAWAYRDFVIKALNADMPYDQFVHWQLAGDEYEPDSALALSATGFLGAGVFPTQITANEVERTRYDALDDMLSTTGSAFLGLTIGCARCHDHKFDPIPTRDYYRLLSTFTTTVRSNIEVELDQAEAERTRQKWQTEHAPLVAAVQTHERGLADKFNAWLASGAELPAEATWTVLEFTELKSEAGTTFRKLEDGSYLAEGPNGAQDVYTAVTTTSLRKLTGLRLEALAHPSMVKNGPGRASNGNFALSRISVTAAPVAGGDEQPVALVKPQVTFEQNNSSLSIASSLDDNPSTGWAVDPQFGKDHAAVFTFAEPVDVPEGVRLTIRLEFRVNGQHNIGRPRISIISNAEPLLQAETLPQAVVEAHRKLQETGSPDKLSEAQRGTLFDWWKRRDADWRTLQARVQEHESQRPKTTTTILICGEGYPPLRHHSQGADFFNETYLLDRGSTDRKQEVVTPSFLQVLMRTPKQEKQWQSQPAAGARFSGRRRALAEWITDVDQGAGALAARVIVNRLWQHHLGTPLVPTPNDFGHSGTQPSHPELLEWLARELIREGWKLKPLHKLIMLSATYQQQSAPHETAATDPGVALFVRRLPQRLEGEVIRDSLLAVSARLDQTMYGPGTKDEHSLRRSIYFMMKRSQLIGSMVVFDQPEPLVSQGSRPTTTVAPQALLLLNGSQIREWSAAFAGRLEGELQGADATPAIRQAYLRALSRPPEADELADALQFVALQQESYAKAGQARPLHAALTDLCQVLFALNEFVYVD